VDYASSHMGKKHNCCGHSALVKGDSHGNCPMCRECSKDSPCAICVHWTAVKWNMLRVALERIKTGSFVRTTPERPHFSDSCVSGTQLEMTGDTTLTQPKGSSMPGKQSPPLSLYSDVSAVTPVHSRGITESAGRIASSISRTIEVARNATTLSEGIHHIDGVIPRYSSSAQVDATDNYEHEKVVTPSEIRSSRAACKRRRRDDSLSPSSTQRTTRRSGSQNDLSTIVAMLTNIQSNVADLSQRMDQVEQPNLHPTEFLPVTSPQVRPVGPVPVPESPNYTRAAQLGVSEDEEHPRDAASESGRNPENIRYGELLTQVQARLGTTFCPVPPTPKVSSHPVGVWDLEEPTEQEISSLPQSPSITKIVETLSSYLHAGDPKNPSNKRWCSLRQPSHLAVNKYKLHGEAIHTAPSTLDSDINQVLPRTGSDNMVFSTFETQQTEQLVRFALGTMSHADHILSAVHCENQQEQMDSAFVLRALPSIAQCLFDCSEALMRTLTNFTIARRRQVMIPAKENLYAADFRTAPFHDTQLFAGVSQSVLDKSFKNPIAWRQTPIRHDNQRSGRRSEPQYPRRRVPTSTYTPMASRESSHPLPRRPTPPSFPSRAFPPFGPRAPFRGRRRGTGRYRP